MQARHQALLLALGLSALLLLASAPAADAARTGRKLAQWGTWGAWSGGGFGWWGYDPSPIGSGCYDGHSGMRYRSGESQYRSGGGRRKCNQGEWEDRSTGDGGWTDWESGWTRKKQ